MPMRSVWLGGMVACVAISLGCSSPNPIGLQPILVDSGADMDDGGAPPSDVQTNDGPAADTDAASMDAADATSMDADVAAGDAPDDADDAQADAPASDAQPDAAACADGGTSCGGACVDTRTDPSHCGACGAACAPANATGSCAAGACAVASCNAGFADCDGAAANGCEINLNTSVTACGACGHACGPMNAAGACTMGVCGVGMCNAGFGDCNDNPADGCETGLATTTSSCGACGAACSVPRATAACAAGRCAVGTCEPGFGDCDMSAANGCEATLNSNANCGACGSACALGTRCSTGTCVSSCPAGTTFCTELQICVNTGSDVANCGACGNACPSPANGTSTCASGACGITCNPGFADCDGAAANGCETNLNTSTGNCARCGNACALANATAACNSGSCTVATCAAGFGDCDANPADGCEVNLNTTARACGSCGTACSLANATAGCAAGRCVVASCADGFADCNMSAADGCETPTNTNANCGACGAVCAAGTRCAGSSCVSSCPAGTTFCAAAGVCAIFATDETNCGMCGTVCPRVANAVPACAAGACGFACNAGYADCDGSAANGCEVNLGTSTASCGSCGNACALPNARAACGTSGCTIAACAAGFSDCNGNPADGCEVNLGATATACGSCANVCAAANGAPTCASGVCAVATCDAGFGDCDRVASNGCEAALNTNANCGGCGTRCASGQFCSGGTCVSSCGASTMYCGGAMACFNLAADVNNCGACGNACPALPNAAPACAAGACGLTCSPGFANCNGRSTDGCEVSIATSPTNCGSCGTACSLANATVGCTSGACSVAACNAGFGDCDGRASTGCETNLNATVASCGSCGFTCAVPNATPSCAGGACGIASCNAGFGDCDRSASDGCERALNTNVNCGACGTRCATGQVCSGGACVSACMSGTTFCAATGSCVDTQTNPDNCGACGNTCPSYPGTTRTCMSGTCSAVCTAGFANCDGRLNNGCETNVYSSNASCGGCGNACTLANATSSCSVGVCTISACNIGFANCDGMAANGCEVNLATSGTNCGTCGRACAAGQTCRLGACR